MAAAAAAAAAAAPLHSAASSAAGFPCSRPQGMACLQLPVPTAARAAALSCSGRGAPVTAAAAVAASAPTRRCGARRGGTRAAASSGGGGEGDAGEPLLPTALSVEAAYAALGLQQGAPFERVVEAKARALQKSGGDKERALEIEAAYDVLFMQSMKRRITGELEVSSSVRYADVPPSSPRSGKRGGSGQRAGGGGGGGAGAGARGGGGGGPAAGLLQRLPGGGVALARTRQSAAAGQAAVFAGLAGWALAQALLEPPAAQAADTAGLQLAAALGFSVYGFREFKRLPGTTQGRAVALSLGALVAGILVGAGLNAWLRLDIVPLGGFGSPGVFVSTFGIAALALASAFLA